MAYAVAETDDDAARMEKCQLKLLGLTVEKLLAIKADLTPVEAMRVARLDTQINVRGQMPDKADVTHIKALAWKYRRKMPAPIAPKLPPHDPIVQEQGLA